LYKNYLEHFNPKDFEISVENSKNIYIYPASISQKNSTFGSDKNYLEFRTIKMDLNGNTYIDNICKFFKI